VVGPVEKQAPRAIESACRAFRLTIGGHDESACQIRGTGAEAQPCEIIWIFLSVALFGLGFGAAAAYALDGTRTPVNTAPSKRRYGMSVGSLMFPVMLQGRPHGV
jgi:hypothetical protein